MIALFPALIQIIDRINSIVYKSTELGSIDLHELSHFQMTMKHIQLGLLLLPCFVCWFFYVLHLRRHADHYYMSDGKPVKASPPNMVIGLVLYIIFVWELKLIVAQKPILCFLEVPSPRIKNAENKDFFRYAFYMSIFFDCIPQLAFKICYHYIQKTYSLHGLISMGIGSFNLLLQVFLALYRLLKGRYGRINNF